MEEQTEYLEPREAQQLLGVSAKTLARYAKKGLLHPKTLPSGIRRYSRAEIETYLNPSN